MGSEPAKDLLQIPKCTRSVDVQLFECLDGLRNDLD